jgi:hypothetical protein
MSELIETSATRQNLEALIFDPDLEKLEALLAQFNIFEALGPVRQERRHSDFLAFLLNPSESHGLSDSLLKRFLRRVLLDVSEPPLGAVEIDLMDMDSARVLREWRNIDILIDDSERNGLVVIIENKVDSSEHSNQLTRYQELVRQEYPHARILPVFLTPMGDGPSEKLYCPMSYNTVAEVLQNLLEAQSSTIGSDVRTLLVHYVSMLRRRIVSDSELVELCQKIYRKHQKALDTLFEYRPDLQAEVAKYCTELVNKASGLSLDRISKSYIGFCPEEWVPYHN